MGNWIPLEETQSRGVCNTRLHQLTMDEKQDHSAERGVVTPEWESAKNKKFTKIRLEKNDKMPKSSYWGA